LDDSNLSIGGLEVVIDGSGIDKTIINFLIRQLSPLVVMTIQDTFEIVICILFGGIPSLA